MSSSSSSEIAYFFCVRFLRVGACFLAAVLLFVLFDELDDVPGFDFDRDGFDPSSDSSSSFSSDSAAPPLSPALQLLKQEINHLFIALHSQ